MPPVATFPRTLTASTWKGVLSSAGVRAASRRGAWTRQAPRLTNAEALQMVRAWTTAAGRGAWPLWYQFAAAAYGWDPEADELDTSDAHGADLYPRDATIQLWAALVDLAADLDKGDNTPSLYFNDDTWTDPLLAGDVRVALRADGADAQFKIPLAACKDPKTGKPVGRPHRDPKTGKWRCDPVVVDDPITHATKHVGTIAAVILLLWLVTSDSKPRRHRRS